MLFLVAVLLSVSVIPTKKAESNPALAIPAGIEIGVGGYVLAAFAVAGGAYVFGQTDAASGIYDHATGVWTSTQEGIKNAWNTTVSKVTAGFTEKDVSKSFSVPISPEILGVFDQHKSSLINDTISDFRKASVSTTTLKYPYPENASLTSLRQNLVTLSGTNKVIAIEYKNIGLVIIDASERVRRYDHFRQERGGTIIFYNGSSWDQRTDYIMTKYRNTPTWLADLSWTKQTGGTLDQDLTNFFGLSGTALTSFLESELLMRYLDATPKANHQFAGYIGENTSTGSFSVTDYYYIGDITARANQDYLADLELPKQGSDYAIKVPPLDQFIPYPKTATGTADLTKGPLVYDPTLKNYKTKTGDIVYNPADVAWSYPLPKIKTDTATGKKIIAYTDSKTGNIENISDDSIESKDEMVFPKNVEDLLDDGWIEDTNEEMRRKTESREFINPNTGERVRFDPGKEGKSGFEGKDHYHRYNPNTTSKKDLYLDRFGNPVAKGSKKSHILPSLGVKNNMSISDLMENFDLHDSLLENAVYDPITNELLLSVELANWRQKDYEETEPEMVNGTFTFSNVTHYSTDPDSFTFNSNEIMDIRMMDINPNGIEIVTLDNGKIVTFTIEATEVLWKEI